MTVFVVIVIGMLLLDSLAKVVLLCMGGNLQRSPVMLGIDVALQSALSMWGIYLIARS